MVCAMKRNSAVALVVLGVSLVIATGLFLLLMLLTDVWIAMVIQGPTAKMGTLLTMMFLTVPVGLGGAAVAWIFWVFAVVWPSKHVNGE